mmetsp:Transcript_89537/g.175247  ORF Transcript_89537/g.175247 Transcript_89537/m.175247 type:complete len:298 (-) Transcript_89537:411-1304(-)
MSDHPRSPLLFENSFTDNVCQEETQREHFDMSTFTTQALDAFIQIGTTTVTNVAENPEHLPAEPTTTHPQLPTLHSVPRHRVKFAKQHLLAGSDLYLKDPAVLEAPATGTLLEEGVRSIVDALLEGVIVECPNKNKPGNLGRYRVDWTRNLPPSFDRSLLAEWFPSTQANRMKLQTAIARYQESLGVEENDVTTPAREENQNSTGEFVGTPPLQVRQANRALLITAAENSTASTLTGGSTQQRSTRRTTTIESESDDDSELDEADNAWDSTEFDENGIAIRLLKSVSSGFSLPSLKI